ncbi:phosphoribosylglycinamide formyltransferase [Sphingomonas sp.]|uniref:phosphoribosylglycinamide formyltransferase n=1 Tax=Sphingomonas sp. TaxID=28214 RepID=UPI000DB16CA0|nr:phosphoribosylglycinamide formyltransferase [Sphingomonas sp.]PZU09628.1 MAG: phosphoribosylglycinamide formyltransferase [Sphingomonas sp.]
MKARVGILISGRGSNMASLVEASRAPDSPYEVVLVVSNVPDAPGLAFAAANGIPTFAASHRGMKRAEFDRLVDGALRDADVEYVALAGYMRLLSPEFVAGWAGRMVNIHPSLLPLYKGLDTHQRALDAGDARHGCSVHIVTEALDDGPILAQAEVPILPGDDAAALATRVLIEEHRLYPAALAALVRGQPLPS